MKKAFNECYKAVVNCEGDNNRKRCELFREIPDRRVRVPLLDLKHCLSFTEIWCRITQTTTN